MRLSQKKPVIDRLMAKVIKEHEGCWLWTGATTVNQRSGIAYGVIGTGERQRTALVHRVAYEYFKGPIPPGFHVDHVRAKGCKSTLCVNPEHLEAVTQQENNRRQRKTTGFQTTHCPEGHPYDDENTYYVKTGKRNRLCRACGRERVANKRAGQSEKEFQAAIVKAAELLGWRSYHTYNSRRSDPGYPDLTMVHPQHGVIFREVKTDVGRLSPAQREWLDAITAAGGDASVWRPVDWPRIEQELLGSTNA